MVECRFVNPLMQVRFLLRAAVVTELVHVLDLGSRLCGFPADGKRQAIA